MLTGILIGALALIAFLYVAVPLLAPGQSDPLPDDRDPVLVDLAEERDALFRAIRELDAREDLPLERRQQLHERYEAKAAKVLVALEKRENELKGRRATRAAAPEVGEAARRKRVPYGAVIVLALLIGIGAVVPGFVLPRIGEDATITTTDMEAATRLRAQQQAVDSDPSVTNLLALGDTYLGLQMLEEAEATFMRAVNSDEPAPAGLYQRLAVIYLQRDLGEARGWLDRARAADPNDIDTLFLLGEVSWAINDLPAAHDAYTDFLALADVPEPHVEGRLALLEEALPLSRRLQETPSKEGHLQLADLYWRAGEQQRAVENYFVVLTDFDPRDPVALSRTGQLLYQAGRPEDAVGTLERAAVSAGGLNQLEPASVRALADSYLQLGEWDGAAATYAAFIELVGEENAADAVELMNSAIARSSGETTEQESGADATAQLSGQQVFATTCAECHGPAGEGGMGTRLAGNPRAEDARNVTDAVRFGRGFMPAFQAELDPAQIEAVVEYVTQVLAPR